MSEIIVGKINYLGPTAIYPRAAEIERLQKLNNFAKQQILAFENLLAMKDEEIAALKAELRRTKAACICGACDPNPG